MERADRNDGLCTRDPPPELKQEKDYYYFLLGAVRSRAKRKERVCVLLKSVFEDLSST